MHPPLPSPRGQAASWLAAALSRLPAPWRAAWQRHLGLPALAALALLAACAACWTLWLPALQRDHAALTLRAQALAKSRAGSDPAALAPSPMLPATDDLPLLRQRGQDLERLVGAAQRQGLALQRADYTVGTAEGRVVRVEALLPLTGSYAQLRPFIATVLNELPHAALDSLQMERQNAQSTQLQVQARWALFYREDAR